MFESFNFKEMRHDSELSRLIVEYRKVMVVEVDFNANIYIHT